MLALGTCGYMWIEGWTFWKSLFFTIITISTVGYGDYGLSDAGMRFTAMLIVAGVGTMTYALGQLIPVFFNEKSAQERAVKNRIRKLSDHFIICGLGRVGRACCECLAQKGLSFVCIEANEEAIRWAFDRDYLALPGDATHDEALNAVGIRWARGLAAVTDSDTENIVITLGAAQLNPELTIVSRADDPDSFHKLLRAGATEVVSPVHAGGVNIATTMVAPAEADLLSSSTAHGVELTELAVAAGSGLDGKSIGECGCEHGSAVLIALVRDDDGARISPEIDTRLRAGDVLIAAGDAIAIGRLQDAAQGLRAAA